MGLVKPKRQKGEDQEYEDEDQEYEDEDQEYEDIEEDIEYGLKLKGTVMPSPPSAG